MVRKYRVWPAGEKQQELGAPASRGRAAAYRPTRARILLPCDEHQPGGAMKDDGMARSPRAGSATAERFVEEGAEGGSGEHQHRPGAPDAERTG